jgi:hypothetical protein
MNLNDYQWSLNPRGMHGTGDNHLRWDEWQLGWIKINTEDNGGLPWAQHALEKGVTPICRIYRNQLSGRPADEGMMRQYFDFINIGVKWFEFYNEPNLPYEWYDGVDLRPDNMNLVSSLCDNWLTWAEAIAGAGGYPGFISLSETTEPWGDITSWMKSITQYMADVHYDRFRNIINAGMWLSVHPYILNHWYQEVPGGGPLSARQANQVNHNEGGWHFEYPYDPICQADDPGRTIWGGTAKQPAGDVFSVLGSGIAWLELFQQKFGVGWIPAVGSEGGIWRIPTDIDPSYQQDPRYPAYDINSHGHGTIAMFDWIASSAPPWMFGLCVWEIDSYWRGGNPIPALGMLSSSPVRTVSAPPAIPALGQAPPPYGGSVEVAQQEQQPPPVATEPPPPTQQPTAAVTATPPMTATPLGPGPVHGDPTYHFVLIAPNLQSWLFESQILQDYWAVFRPNLMPSVDVIDFFPSNTSLAVTLIIPLEEIETTRNALLNRWAFLFLDIIAAADLAAVETILDRRIRNNVRFS